MIALRHAVIRCSPSTKFLNFKHVVNRNSICFSHSISPPPEILPHQSSLIIQSNVKSIVSMQAFLVRLSDATHSCALPFIILNSGITTIGRRGIVSMDTPTGHHISNLHASIRCIQCNLSHSSARWFIDDHASVSGAFANGVRIFSRDLVPNDGIIFRLILTSAIVPRLCQPMELSAAIVSFCRIQSFDSPISST
jgi:hypothetical protein